MAAELSALVCLFNWFWPTDLVRICLFFLVFFKINAFLSRKKRVGVKEFTACATILSEHSYLEICFKYYILRALHRDTWPLPFTLLRMTRGSVNCFKLNLQKGQLPAAVTQNFQFEQGR